MVLISGNQLCAEVPAAASPISFTYVSATHVETVFAFDKRGRVIFPDDTINTVLKKIAAFALGAPSDIYLWATRPVDPSEYAATFVRNVMRGKRVVHIGEAEAALRALSGDSKISLQLSRDMVSGTELLKAVLACKRWRNTCEPLTIRRFDNGYSVYLPVDPFQPMGKQPWTHQVDQYDTSSYGDTTLETMLHGDMSLDLKFTTREQITAAGLSEALFFYSSASDSDFDAAAYKVIVAQNDKQIARVWSTPHDDQVRQACQLRSITLSHNHDNFYLPAEESIDMWGVFRRLETTRLVPYVGIKPSSLGDAMHKVFPRRFATATESALPCALLRRWCKYTRHTFHGDKGVASAERVLTFAVALSEHAWVFITCDARLTWEMQFEFSSDSDGGASLDSMWSASIEKVVDWLRQALPATKDRHRLMPHVTKDALRAREDGTLVKLSYILEVGTTQKSTPSLPEFLNTVRCAVQSLFLVNPEDGKTKPKTAKLTYIRHDNYRNVDAVFQTLNESTHLSRADAVLELLDTFNDLNPSEAQMAYDDWQNMTAVEAYRGAGHRLFVRPKHRFDTSVELRDQGSIGYKCMVRNVTRFEHVPRINAALRFCLTNRADKCRRNIRAVHPSKAAPAAVLADFEDVDFEDDEEIDESFLAELQRDVAKAQSETGVNKHTHSVPHGYLIESLQKADRKLFAKRVYGMSCSRTDDRQPIVIDAQDKKRIDARFPGSYEGFVQTGSTPELFRKNIYICPYVWCPKSRISLSAEQFAELGQKCPDAHIDEHPLVMNNPNHWGKRTVKYPGLFGPAKHPNGLRMPCCFKTKQDDGASTEGSNDNKKYIRSALQFPALPGRMALLHPGLAPFFGGNGVCGNRHDGTGKITKRTDCFVRFGLSNPGAQSFLGSAAYIHNLKNNQDLSERLVALLQNNMPLFLSLNSGKTCTAFGEVDSNTSHPPFATFAAWLPRQTEYIKRFGLAATVANLHAPGSAEVHWQYELYSALSRFLRYLRNDFITKTPAHLLDLLDRCAGKLSSPTKKLLLFDTSNDGGVSIACDNVLSIGSDALVGVIVRKTSIYEPIVHVSTAAASTKIITQTAMQLTPKARSILQLYQTECHGHRSPFADTALRVCKILLARKSSFRQVLDRHHRLRGFLVKLATERVLIPVPQGTGLIWPDVSDGVSQLPEALTSVHASVKTVINLLRALRETTASDFYSVESVSKEVVRLKSGDIVPLRSASGSLSYRQALLDASLAGWPSRAGADARKKWIKDVAQRERTYTMYRSEVDAAIDRSPDLQTKLYYLQHPLNPLSVGDRMRVMESFLTPVMNRIARDESLKERVLRQIVKPTLALQTVAPLDDMIAYEDADSSVRSQRGKSRMFTSDQLDESMTDDQILSLLKLGGRDGAEEADPEAPDLVKRLLVDTTFDALRRQMTSTSAVVDALKLDKGSPLPGKQTAAGNARAWAFPNVSSRFQLMSAVIAQAQPYLQTVSRNTLEAIAAQNRKTPRTDRLFESLDDWRSVCDVLDIPLAAVDVASKPTPVSVLALTLDVDAKTGAVRGVVLSENPDEGLLVGPTP